MNMSGAAAYKSNLIHLQRSSNLNCENSAKEGNIDLRLVHAAVVEDETGVCKSQAGLLRLQIELHDLVVTCRKCVNDQDKWS